jgi:hypothetical protein
MQQLPEGVRETVNSIHQELKPGTHQDLGYGKPGVMKSAA